MADMNFFVDAFTEAQMSAHEYYCEMIRENCDYDDEDQCYEDADYHHCHDHEDDKLDLQEYLECTQFDENYYIGPYCADDNYSLYLGLFTDNACTNRVDNSKFSDVYGYELPYSDKSIIDDDCARCREHGLWYDKSEGDQQDEDDVIEQCEDLYEYNTAKCEEEIDVQNPDTDGCESINQLKKEENVVSSRGSYITRRKLSWFAFIVAAVAVVALVGGFIFCRRRVRKENSALRSETKPSKQSLI